MALPNDKITTTLVANTLGTSSRDVGTLCTHQSVNKFSIPKPISLNILNPTLVNIKVSGFKKSIQPTFTKAGLLVYNKPTGGANSPYRLGDFRGYNHNAPIPSFDTNLIEYTNYGFGDIADNSSREFSSWIINNDFLKRLKAEGYFYVSSYETTNNLEYIESNAISDVDVSIPGVSGSIELSSIKTPNLPSIREFEFYVSQNSNNDPWDSGAFEIEGSNNKLRVSSVLSHENCVSSVTDVSRPINPDPDTPIFPVDVSNYKHATTINFIDGSVGFILLINLNFTLTQAQKNAFNFSWDSDAPYQGTNLRRIVIKKINTDGSKTLLPIAGIIGCEYIGNYVSPEESVVFNNAVLARIVLKDPITNAEGSQLDVEFFDGIVQPY